VLAVVHLVPLVLKPILVKQLVFYVNLVNTQQLLHNVKYVHLANSPLLQELHLVALVHVVMKLTPIKLYVLLVHLVNIHLMMVNAKLVQSLDILLILLLVLAVFVDLELK